MALKYFFSVPITPVIFCPNKGFRMRHSNHSNNRNNQECNSKSPSTLFCSHDKHLSLKSQSTHQLLLWGTSRDPLLSPLPRLWVTERGCALFSGGFWLQRSFEQTTEKSKYVQILTMQVVKQNPSCWMDMALSTNQPTWHRLQ